MQRMEVDHKKRQAKWDKKEREKEKNRAAWVGDLKADPDRVRNPKGLPEGTFTCDQYALMATLLKNDNFGERDRAADWKGLTEEFGQEVAEAYRDAALASWRNYKPKLGSEGAQLNSTPFALIFAMVGLAIEAGDNADFPNGLSKEDARKAVRFVIWQLNGVPRWFERLYRLYPDIVRAAAIKELLWELENTSADAPMHYILHDLVYHAPWLHVDLAPILIDWLRTHQLPNDEALRYALTIATGGSASAGDLVDLAKTKLSGTLPPNRSARWLALWVDSDADTGMPMLQKMLNSLPSAEASGLAQLFIVNLIGGRHGNGKRRGGFQTVKHLKDLYVLMHRHIRTEDDIERANRGAYSPTLRDDAQEARSALFSMLVEVPGADAYAAIKALEEEHPNEGYRAWMGKSAHRRAVADADEKVWGEAQIAEFVQRLAPSNG